MPPNIRLHRHAHCYNSCKIFSQTSSVLTCRNCIVCQTVFMMLCAGHFVTDNICKSLSPIYPNLWMCLVRDSGLFIFLTKILIWSYSVAVLSQLYWAWIKDKEYLSLSLSHTRTHTCVQYPDCFQFLQYLTACLTILCRFLSYTTCQTHFGSKLAASLSAATYSSSRFSKAANLLPKWVWHVV